MNKLFLKVLTAATMMLGAACTMLEMPDLYPTVTEEQAPERFVPYQTVHVNVPDGFKSVVYVGNTKIATLYQSGDVMVPKTVTTKAVSGYQVVNVLNEAGSSSASENTLEMVLAFEDTKDGDHDYNDLIFQARVEITNNTDGSSSAKATITPVALGASRSFSLGLVLTGADNKVISDNVIAADCRTVLFEGDEGFINTYDERKHYSQQVFNIKNSAGGAVAGVSWYIVVAGQRLYASTSFQASLDNSDAPQGLVLMKLRDDVYYTEEGGMKYYCGNDFWQYPKESTAISEVYPQFWDAFISGGDFSVLAEPVKDWYDAIAASEEGLLSQNCLYSTYRQGGESHDVTPGMVQLWENGVKWATFNVGATKPEESGLFFSWGNLDGYYCPGDKCDHNFADYWEKTPGGLLTGSFTPGDIQYDAARFYWGGSWRMPTYQEIYDLVLYTNYQYVDNYNGTGIAGGIFTSKSDPSKFIFIPATGVVEGYVHKGTNEGRCWTSEIGMWSEAEGRIVVAGTTKSQVSNYGRNKALTIRPVCD